MGLQARLLLGLGCSHCRRSCNIQRVQSSVEKHTGEQNLGLLMLRASWLHPVRQFLGHSCRPAAMGPDCRNALTSSSREQTLRKLPYLCQHNAAELESRPDRPITKKWRTWFAIALGSYSRNLAYQMLALQYEQSHTREVRNNPTRQARQVSNRDVTVPHGSSQHAVASALNSRACQNLILQ